ncbi:two-component system, sensor histidine kinase YesM [Paenibacillus sp. UNCCL117]|uniref:cache domain-containing sensor histidine kinase n=1 Tax=unclassified Paenibacillus TaxID=185978 RepID=UPI00087EC66C|nr:MULTISPECIES: sensor histidine kinase [unclassified Paenibacillus]SDC43248.1 two-component system, sensor histidine kinase YesM [Paenibacillus sp. cl123]SFW12998.1 two-component system, sensor histidine kinase YesM [Paenibacillus sp. UNCCL117]
MEVIITRRRRKPSRLYHRIVIPVTMLLIALVLTLTLSAGAVLVAMQNAQTEREVRQSMDYVYRSVWYQFNSLKNIPSFILSSRELESMLEQRYTSREDAVNDYFSLFTELESMSLISLLNEVDPYNHAQISYMVSVLVGQSSGLYELATDRVATVGGIYKDDDVREAGWYRKLSEAGNPMVWWAEPRPEGGGYIYTAKRKVSLKDGRDLGVVVVAYSIQNIGAILSRSGLVQGEYLLVDDESRIVYGSGISLGEDKGRGAFLEARTESGSGTFREQVGDELAWVSSREYENGWRLISIVPVKHLDDYSGWIVGIVLTASLLVILVTSLLLRRIAARLSRPITELAGVMKRVELGDLQEPERKRPTMIEEIDLLHRGYSHMIARLNQLIQEVYVQDLTAKQLQLELLQAQINPHFMYNTLDMINCRALSRGDPETGRISRLLASVLRLGLNNGSPTILLADELRQVRSYLDIQMLMNEGLSYTIEADEGLAGTRVVHFMLQPVVENCIVHGFRAKRGDCRIRIRAWRVRRELLIEVSDNGCGVDASLLNQALEGGAPPGAAGFGTRNVDRRIKLHAGPGYGVRYEETTEEGTCVRIRLPAEEAAAE